MTTQPKRGTVDGGVGRGVPMPGRDSRPATGYGSTKKELEEDETITDEPDLNEFESDETEAADRRRDPLRR